MYALVAPFFQLCLLRKRPQDLPPSHLLLALTLATYSLCGVVASLVRLPLGQALFAGVLDALILASLTATLLAALSLWPRLIQTLTALAGASTVLSVLAMPVIFWVHASIDSGIDAGLVGAILWIFVLWSFLVVGHVLRHALSSSMTVGVAVSFVFYLVSLSVQLTLFSDSA